MHHIDLILSVSKQGSPFYRATVWGSCLMSYEEWTCPADSAQTCQEVPRGIMLNLALAAC